MFKKSTLLNHFIIKIKSNRFLTGFAGRLLETCYPMDYQI